MSRIHTDTRSSTSPAVIVIREGHVVDPAHGVDMTCDIRVESGQVAEVGSNLATSTAALVLDASELVVMPGVVDSHVHLTDLSHDSTSTSTTAQYRLVQAGVTTAVEFFDFTRALDQWHSSCSGMTLLGLQGVRSHDVDPTTSQVQTEIQDALSCGAIGMKLLGGHFPNSPQTTARVIEQSYELGAYVAAHAGTTRHGSEINGMRESIELADGRPLHVAHTNAYLRGATADVEQENLEALRLLLRSSRLVSEAHLGSMNLCLGALSPGGGFADHIASNCLRLAGYETDSTGAEQAFLDGYAHILCERNGVAVSITGTEGLELWRSDPHHASLNFPVNNRLSAFMQACARTGEDGRIRYDGEGEFVVDAISSDGGTWRNVILERGLSLVQMGALDLVQLVSKASLQPARMFGMTNKGHLGAGADGDVIGVDPRTGTVAFTIANGRLVWDGQRVIGTGGKVLTTEHGVTSLRDRGIPHEILDLEHSTFRTRRSRRPVRQDPGKAIV